MPRELGPDHDAAQRDGPTRSASWRRQRARIGGLAASAKNGGKAQTAAARESWLQQFERRVDPLGTLTPRERERRAALARKAHMARLALRSAQVRANRRRNGAS